MSEVARVGTGITITFASGFLAEIIDVGGPGMTRGEIDTSHMGTTGGKTFKPTSLYDPGGLNVDIAFDPSETPPITSARAAVTVTWPDGSTWAFNGFMTGYEPTAPLEEKMTASCTIKASGSITITGASS